MVKFRYENLFFRPSLAVNLLSNIIAIIIAVSVHEFCHAWMANRLGDPTGKLLGRMTFNPLRHFDPIGTLSLIFFGIGWGKPVPFNPNNLENPKRDSALIALAGPVSNLLLAIATAVPLKYLFESSVRGLPVYELLQSIFAINVVLFALNVLPFPPFDGSKIIGIFIPHRWAGGYERYLQKSVLYVILFILFDVLVIEKIAGFSLLSLMINTVAGWIIALISLGT